VPLYQGGTEYATVRQAKEQRSQSLANITDTDRQVREGAQSAWGTLIGARASIGSNQMAVEANQSALMGVMAEQRAGERSILDVLNAQQELLGSEISLASADHDAAVAAFQLLNAIGVMGAADLGLDVKLYNPLQHYDAHSAAWFSLSAWNPK
jgi:outer membrane protein